METDTKERSERLEKLQGDLAERIAGIVGKATSDDKAEVEKREAELKGIVDEAIEAAKADSTAVDELKAKIDEQEQKLRELGQLPATSPASGGAPASAEVRKHVKDRYGRANLFADMKAASRGDRAAAEAIAEYEEKFAPHPESDGFSAHPRVKAWATGDLEDVDLVLPDVQAALPFLAAQAKLVQRFREIRTSSPAVEFPVFTTGLDVGHHDDQTPTAPGSDWEDVPNKPYSEPEFDLVTARVFSIAGVTGVPNSTLEDFPAARGWIASELGRATGSQEEIDVLTGDGTGEPLGVFSNPAIPTMDVETGGTGVTPGRHLINSIFRAAQSVRRFGFTEPTDIGLNPAVWTDVVLTFEDNIGYLYGPNNSNSAGAPLNEPPERILGLPVTQSPFVPDNEGGGGESPILVGNFQDGIVLRRSPFRVDADTSLGFLKNRTLFRGEERMGFVVVRPGSFRIVEGFSPTPLTIS